MGVFFVKCGAYLRQECNNLPQVLNLREVVGIGSPKRANGATLNRVAERNNVGCNLVLAHPLPIESWESLPF